MIMKKIGWDKYVHFGAGLLIAFAAFFGLGIFELPKELILSCTIVAPFLGGLAKEFWDVKRGGKFDCYDLLATVLGGCVLFVPCLLVYLFSM